MHRGSALRVERSEPRNVEIARRVVGSPYDAGRGTTGGQAKRGPCFPASSEGKSGCNREDVRLVVREESIGTTVIAPLAMRERVRNDCRERPLGGYAAG